MPLLAILSTVVELITLCQHNLLHDHMDLPVDDDSGRHGGVVAVGGVHVADVPEGVVLRSCSVVSCDFTAVTWSRGFHDREILTNLVEKGWLHIFGREILQQDV